jgi:replication factor C small subunit
MFKQNVKGDHFMDLRKNIWVYKYRPQTFDDIILNEDIKPKLRKALDEIPNLLLYGNSGVGKGCFADIMIQKDNIDHMWVNASDESGIDVFRNKIRPFATAMCLKDLKIIILNECDSMTSGPQGSQKLLRQLMEDTYKLARFLLICNYDGYIIPEIKSRCQVIKVDNPPAKEIGKLCLKILRQENIQFDPKVAMEIVKKCYPDIRKTINVLQENSVDGKLVGSSLSASEDIFRKILNLMLEKDLDGVREELKSNYIPYPELYQFLYENAGEFKEPGGAILGIGKHLFQDTTISIKEVNFMTMFVDFIYKKVV